MYDICETSATILAAGGEVMYKQTTIPNPLVSRINGIGVLYSTEGSGTSIECIIISNYSTDQDFHHILALEYSANLQVPSLPQPTSKSFPHLRDNIRMQMLVGKWVYRYVHHARRWVPLTMLVNSDCMLWVRVFCSVCFRHESRTLLL